MKSKMSERSSQQPLPFTELTAISPIDGRYRHITQELAPFTSEYALIKTRFEIEAKYLVALSKLGLTRKLKKEEIKRLNTFGENISTEDAQKVKEIEDETRHDVKAMERAFREMVQGSSLEDLTEWIHFGLTSEDVNNLSYRLMVKRATEEVCIPTLDELIAQLAQRTESYRALPMQARTHGQPAVTTTLGKEFGVFATRLNGEVRKLEVVKLTGKINGAVGNYNALRFVAPNVNWEEFSESFVQSLGLKPNLITTQINPYEDVIEYFQAIQRINSTISDFDSDMWRYISDDWLVQEVRKGEVGSSTMPQKVNPINFENSEGNLKIANSYADLFTRMLSESRLQRDLRDSTVIRNIGSALAHSLIGYTNTLEGLARIRPNGEKIAEDLNSDWAILTEAVQIYLRRVGVEDPYSLVAQLARGERIDQAAWQNWIDKLPVSDEHKAKLHELTPQTYIGDAVKLSDLAGRITRRSRKR